MELKEVIRELKKAGTAQNRKVYARHGAGENCYGVSFAILGKLKKKIGVNHELAVQLWGTKNMDAMSLATMIADPTQINNKLADLWVKDMKYYMLVSLFAEPISKSDIAKKKALQWMKSTKEFTKQSGYSVVASMLKNGSTFTRTELKGILKNIENQIHSSPNRARYAMNYALIAIGMYTDLKNDAIKVAKKIGKVEVDHGETSCKTPDAVSYIEKALKRKHC